MKDIQNVIAAANIRYDKDSETLFIIDQTLLPGEEREIPLEPAEETSALDYPEGEPFARDDGDLDATRRINLDDLKFGRNYSGD